MDHSRAELRPKESETFQTMREINTVIAGVASYLPEDKITNDDIAKLVDTTDEWITRMIGIKERRVLKGEGKGSSFMGVKAVENLLAKTRVNPDEIDIVICATSTPDHIFPSTASIIAEQTGIKHAFCFEVGAACSGFIYAMEIANGFIQSRKYRKILVVCAEKMTSITNYTDRASCPIFGDGAAAVLVIASEAPYGIIDSKLMNENTGFTYLHMKAGGSVRPATEETIRNHEHTVYQEGHTVFKYAVSRMSDAADNILKINGMTHEDLKFLVPHQANIRIIEAVGKRIKIPTEKVMINIDHVGNTSAASIPICLAEFESQLHKGDKLLLTSFGAGFTFGAMILSWGYDPE